MLKKESSLGYVYKLAEKSEAMLKATLGGDITTMLDILEFAHNTEIPLLAYNNESDLAALINLVYLAARDYYRWRRKRCEELVEREGSWLQPYTGPGGGWCSLPRKRAPRGGDRKSVV